MVSYASEPAALAAPLGARRSTLAAAGAAAIARRAHAARTEFIPPGARGGGGQGWHAHVAAQRGREKGRAGHEHEPLVATFDGAAHSYSHEPHPYDQAAYGADGPGAYAREPRATGHSQRLGPERPRAGSTASGGSGGSSLLDTYLEHQAGGRGGATRGEMAPPPQPEPRARSASAARRATVTEGVARRSVSPPHAARAAAVSWAPAAYAAHAAPPPHTRRPSGGSSAADSREDEREGASRARRTTSAATRPPSAPLPRASLLHPAGAEELPHLDAVSEQLRGDFVSQRLESQLSGLQHSVAGVQVGSAVNALFASRGGLVWM